MSRLPEGNWRVAQDATSQGQSTAPRSTSSRRGRQQGEYWRQTESNRVDIYAALDDWRAYRNNQNANPFNTSAPTDLNRGFEPDGHISKSQTHHNGRVEHAQYQPQVYTHLWQNDPRYSYPAQPQMQDFHGQRQVHFDATSTQSHMQWPQYHQDPYGALRSDPPPYMPMRIPNGVQERQQVFQGLRGVRGNQQTDFTQQIPYRAFRGVGNPRGHATSRSRPTPPVEHGKILPPGIPIARESHRRALGRERTPQIENSIRAPPPTAPVATQAYLNQAHLQPEQLTEAKRMLVIMDLNGTLMLKPDYRRPGNFHVRPGAPKLLKYLFEKHIVMVYTSAQPHNAEMVARGLFSVEQYGKLAAIWARDKLDLTPAQYHDKVQVYKKLDKIWANNEVQASFVPSDQGKWDQTNTILVDDSHLKALQEPHNLLQVPEFTAVTRGMSKKSFNKREAQICESLIVKLEELKYQSDVSRLIWRWQTGKADIPRVAGSNVFVDEKVDQKEQAKRDLEAAMNLPTPTTPERSDDEAVTAGSGGGDVLLLNPEVHSSGQRNGSLSPVTEDTFKDLLGKRGVEDSMPTPTSQDG